MGEQAMMPSAGSIGSSGVLTASTSVVVVSPPPLVAVPSLSEAITDEVIAGGGLDDDVAARLAVVVGRLHRRIRPNHDGLSHGLISALGTIVRYREVRPGDLARIESVAAPTMTRILADLEGKGLVARRPDPSDRRSFFVTATDAGNAAIRRARLERAERISRLLEDLPEDQLAQLEAAIEALEAAAESGATPAAVHHHSSRG